MLLYICEEKEGTKGHMPKKIKEKNANHPRIRQLEPTLNDVNIIWYK
jgi:hypothetical protein